MTKKAPRKLFIPRGDAFDIGISTYWEDERFEKVRKLMSDRRFTVGETSIAYRVMNHWDQLGLLPDGAKGEGGWRKFTMPEMVWLRVIVRMRDFGLSLKKIALAKSVVMEWHRELEQYLDFEYYISEAWFSDADPYVLVLSNGEAEVATMAEIEAAKILLDSFDVLLISLKSILKDIGLNVAAPKMRLSLSDDEIELLASTRFGNNSEVRAKVGSRGEITEIETTETSNHPLAQHKIKGQAEQEKMYGRVVTQYENGVPQSVQITKRKRLKS